jgi:hypothetical protein
VSVPIHHRALALALIAAGLTPAAAWGHASERAVILLLPTGYYAAGAAAAVALTAILGLAAPRLPAPAPRRLAEWRPRLPEALPSWIAALVLAALIVVGFLGSRDPLGNLLPLTVWTLFWVGLPLLTIAFGDLWRPINPWTGPVRAARRLLGRTGAVGLSRLGYWPAALGFFAFAWFEMVSLAPDDPEVLARTVAAYWLAIFLLAVAEGEDWLDRGEAFTVYFAFIARIAPLWRECAAGRMRLMAGLPGAQILRMAPLGPSAMAFVTLILASVTFDGLSETFRWLAFLGINPLEFPGRSAVMLQNSLGLLVAWALTAATILGAIALGRRLGGSTAPFRAEAGAWMLSFLPIAAGYHVAHYLVALLTNGQYAIVALSDPFHRHWNLLGLPEHWVSFAFLTDPVRVIWVWNAQFAAILFAHVVAVLLSLALAARFAAPRPAALHLPMTLLMVGYTVLGLWLLSAPVGA